MEEQKQEEQKQEELNSFKKRLDEMAERRWSHFGLSGKTTIDELKDSMRESVALGYFWGLEEISSRLSKMNGEVQQIVQERQRYYR